MYDFSTFDGDKFYEAVQNKDYDLLISDFICAIRSDPAFKKAEIPQIIRIFEEKVPEIFKEEVRLDYEEELPRSEWNKDYFYRQLHRLQNNFCKKRLAYLKEVGQAVFREPVRTESVKPAINQTATQNRSRTAQTSGRPASYGQTNRKPPVKNGNFPNAGMLRAAGILAAIILGVLLVIFLIK